jgi:DNA polymerase
MTDPLDLLHQVAEHLRLEQAMGGDWIPVTRREPEKTGGRGRARGLARLPRAVRAADPETVDANEALLAAVAAEIAACRACPLHASRTHTVPGEGHPAPRLVFVGEGPGAEEDACGRPFVGRSGELLTRMIEAMGLERTEVFILNTVKCRPPGNRTPEGEEMARCRPVLERQLGILAPEVIVALGRPASQSLLRTSAPISRLRGRWQEVDGVAVMPTFHPSYLLRNATAKKDAWSDLKQVHRRLASA